jgi:hypothetical protein
MRAQQVLDAIAGVVVEDMKRAQDSRIRFFLGGAMKGGWEAWLQAECGVAVSAAVARDAGAGRYTVQREVAYGAGAGAKRADLLFAPAAAGAGGAAGPALAGVKIWIEFKTQRDAAYGATLTDFRSDMDKLRSAAASGDVAVAAAILVGDPAADAMLKKLDRPAGTSLGAFVFCAGGSAAETWSASSKPTTAADVVLLWWKNS